MHGKNIDLVYVLLIVGVIVFILKSYDSEK